jgi:chromosome segregation ATPase
MDDLNLGVIGLVGVLGGALITAAVTLITLRVNKNKRDAEAAKLEAETEMVEVEVGSCVASMYLDLLETLREEIERKDVEHNTEITSLKAALAAIKVEQERIREHYQDQIEMLEAKIDLLQRELNRERRMRQGLQQKYEGIVTDNGKNND